MHNLIIERRNCSRYSSRFPRSQLRIVENSKDMLIASDVKSGKVKRLNGGPNLHLSYGFCIIVGIFVKNLTQTHGLVLCDMSSCE